MTARICQHPFLKRPMTREDVSAVIRRVADGDADFAVIESNDDDFMQFVAEAPDTFYLEYVKNAVPMVPGSDVKLNEKELSDLLGRYLGGEPIETLTAGWVTQKPAGSSKNQKILVVIAFIIGIAVILAGFFYAR